MAVQAYRKKRRQELLWSWGLPLAVFAVGAGLWELTTINSESLIIPTFTETMVGLYELLFVSPKLWAPLLLSNQAMVLGYLLSVVVGVGSGLAMARVRWLEGVADPYVHILLAMPTAPLIPLVMMALGLGVESRVFIVFQFTFIYITVNTRAGVRGVDKTLIEMAKSFGASEGQTWWRILIPGALPAIAAGLRIGLGRAVNGMVVAELLLVAAGIGNLLLEFRAAFQGGLMFATVFAIALEAIVLLTLMRWMEDRIAPWASGAAQD